MTSTTPETAPDIPPAQQRPPHINGAPDVLQIESLDRFLGADNNLRIASDGDTDAYHQGKIRLAQMIKDQLEASGITPDADNPEKNEEYEYAAGLLAEIVGMSEDEWMNREGTGRRNQIFRDLLTRYRPTPEIPEEEPTGPEDDDDDNERSIDTIRTELDQAREAWSVMQAKRQGRLFDRRIKGYNAAKEKYETLQRELGSKLLEDTVNDADLSDAEKNAAVIGYIFDEQRSLRAVTTEKVKNTKVGRFVEKVGGWLNAGDGWSKFGKGVVIGAGAGVVGAGVGLIFGFMGIGGIVAGVSTIVLKSAMRFPQAYAKSDARQGRGMADIDNTIRDEMISEINDAEGSDLIEKGVGLSDKLFAHDVDKEQVKRRKTTALALGGMALGAGVGAAAGFALDHLSWFEGARNSLSDVRGNILGSGKTAGGGGISNNATPHHFDWTPDDDMLSSNSSEVGAVENTGSHHFDWTPEDDALGNSPEVTDVELPSFEFDYGTATEHLLQDVASKQLGVELDGRDAYLLINHLMEQTGGNVFDGVDTVMHSPGDVWIMNPGGETSGLTADALKIAQEWLDMGRPGLPSAGV